MQPNPALQGVGSTRLKVNQFLNQSGRQGRVAGNALGILGLFFSTSESGLGYLSDGQTPDWLNTLGAGMSQPYQYLYSSHPKDHMTEICVTPCY